MTQAIVSAVVKKLADLVIDEFRLQIGLGRKVNEVKLQLSQMQCFLKDADSKKKRGDERIKGWVHDVRNVAYETEDAIDTFLVEANPRKLGFIPNGLARRTLSEKLSRIQAKLRIISEGRTTFGIKDLSENGGHSESLFQTQPSFKRRVLPDVDNSEVIGFEAEKREIINLLMLHGRSDQSRRVISIVGPGGLGKTTLAQKVYTSSTVRNHFDSCLWITVSQNFNLLDVLKKIRMKLANSTELKGESQEDQIVFLLGEVNALLKNKNYLIVLDDVWSEKVFTQLETGLVNVGNGIRVLMTSRFFNVANCADSSGVYPLRFLSEGESLRLLLKKALLSSDPSPKCPDELSDLARKLVKRCDGLPLALIVLGGLLSSKPPMPREWSRVLQMLDWHVLGDGECMRILATSYDDLLYLHKSCFRYLACFPEDYEIQAEPLMNMWIAEGLIDVRNGMQLEGCAEDYLEELVQRCLVQVVERSPDGAIKSIRVHDLLREVALSEAKENDFLYIWKEEHVEQDVSMTRRVAFHKGIDASNDNDDPGASTKISNIKMPKLRTFLYLDQCNDIIGSRFLLLRVLELRNTKSFKDLPTDLKKMIHLRYLGLEGTQVFVIPSWIGHLQNLQTFDISHTVIQELPESFWKITSLRHVHYSSISSYVDQFYCPLVGPPSTANLVNLRSLGSFQVPISWKKSFPYLIGVRKLNLHCKDRNDGMLMHDLISKLKNLLSVRFDNFYPPRKMIDFSTSPSYENIHTMCLSGNATVGIAELPANLTKLTLFSFVLNGDPMPKLEKLRSLKCLDLNFITIMADTIVCTYGGFPRLQSLKLNHVQKIMEWKVDYGALPVLNYLLIKSCNDLRALPDLQCVTTLQELKIDPELQSKIKNKSGEEWQKVKHIPTII
ncbi:putative disease resistance RPP13-like protein 3 [Carex rostrata]